MARSFFSLVLLFAATPAAFAQRNPIEPPVANRPADFSNLVGKYDIKASAEPTEVHVLDPIMLRIEISGEGPPKFEPNRKQLRLFPDSWHNDFYVQEMEDQHEVHRDKKTWVFVYRLKPKHARIDAINDIKLVWYDPESRAEKKFHEKYARNIRIKVKPKAEIDRTIVESAAAPDSFFHVADSGEILTTAPTHEAITGWQIALVLVVPPLACFVGAFTWRRLFPDDATRARLYRDRSAARARAQLQAGAPAWDVVRRFLHERFNFAVEDAIPAEVVAFLDRRGFAKSACEQGRAFFEACDAARFNIGAGRELKALAEEAVRLIDALEADRCACG